VNLKPLPSNYFSQARKFLYDCSFHPGYYSIFWKVSPLKAKKRIRSSCNQLAFDVYSHMIDLAHLLNQYAADKNSEGIIAPKSWQELVNNLADAFRWIEREHPTEINSLQLSLPSVTQPALED
jgi:hypothetical protein